MTDIPQIIHHIWVGSPLPDRLRPCVDSWKTHHPGWEHWMWGDDDLKWLVNRRLYDRARVLVPPDAVGQFRADIARYEILHRYGGLYVDADTTCLRPIDDALAGHDAFAAAEDATWVGNTYLAAVPDHPVMGDLAAGIPASVARHHGRRPNWTTGPRYLTPIWKRHGCHIAEQRLFFPYSYAHLKQGNVPTDIGADVYAIHEWDHTRTVLARRRR